MGLRCYDDATVFARRARPLLEADPARHTIELTVLDAVQRDGSATALMATVEDDEGAVVGAVLRTPGRPALVSAVPLDRAAEVERAVTGRDPELPGVTGPAPVVEAIAAAHVARTGATAHVDMRMRLFVLDVLRPPAGVPGSARLATTTDLDLLSRWGEAFADEATHGLRDPHTAREHAEAGLALGHGQLLWEVDGSEVAWAVARRPVAGMARVGPVFTPTGHRGRGYGGAVTAAATRWALDSGARRVVLFTDLANPTTNALYPRLGYRPAHDALEVSFT